MCIVIVIYYSMSKYMPIPVAALSNASVCGCSLAGTVGSNTAGGKDVCFLWRFCVVRYRYLRRADHSPRRVLPSVVCTSVIVRSRKWGGLGPLGGCCAIKRPLSIWLKMKQFKHHNNMRWVVKIIMQCSSVPSHFLPFRPKYIPQHPTLEHPHLTFFPYYVKLSVCYCAFATRE